MTRRYGGTGLGLAISTRLADLARLGPRRQRPGEGATFTLECRCRSRRRRKCAIEPPAAAPRERSLRILVADDDPINRRIAQRLLERLGHRVRTVVDGAGSSKPGGAASTT
jgi:hypothetical protein